jgi:hypothetical protein
VSEIFKKLNLKDQKEILVLNAPPGFDPELASLQDVTVRHNLDEVKGIDFSLAFVIRQQELDEISAAVAQKVRGDAVIWFAYPKGTSKKYKCEFNRDTGWHVLGAAGFEPVRMVAIDADWSALRFRRAVFIKDMKRRSTMALSDEGKSKTQNTGE